MHTHLTGTSGVPHASSHACPFQTHFLAAVFSFATVTWSMMLLQCPSLFTHAERENSTTAAVTLYTTPCVLCLSGCMNETTRLVGQQTCLSLKRQVPESQDPRKRPPSVLDSDGSGARARSQFGKPRSGDARRLCQHNARVPAIERASLEVASVRCLTASCDTRTGG